MRGCPDGGGFRTRSKFTSSVRPFCLSLGLWKPVILRNAYVMFVAYYAIVIAEHSESDSSLVPRPSILSRFSVHSARIERSVRNAGREHSKRNYYPIKQSDSALRNSMEYKLFCINFTRLSSPHFFTLFFTRVEGLGNLVPRPPPRLYLAAMEKSRLFSTAARLRDKVWVEAWVRS